MKSIQEQKENTSMHEDAPSNPGKQEDAKVASYILHAIAIALLLFLLVWRDDYQIAWSLCILFPLLPYLIYRYYNGFINIPPTRGKSNPSIGIAMLTPPFAMILAVMDYQYLNSQILYLYGMIFAILMVLPFLKYIIDGLKKEGVSTFFSIAYILVSGYFYGYGLISYANSQYDHSKEQIYKAQILNKYRIHGSKVTTNYLVLGPWGPEIYETKLSVRLPTYDQFSIADTAYIKLKSGAIGIPWYTICTNTTWEESVSKL